MKKGKYVDLDNPDTDEPLEIIKECWVCLEPVNGAEIINNKPTCYTCVNAHYIHNSCYGDLKEKKCYCEEAIDRYCYTRTTGLVVVPNRKGGKTKKGTKKAKKNKKSRKSKKKGIRAL
jgi:hypothetical protein